MRPEDSATLFQEAVTAVDMTVDALCATTALEQMTAFYRNVRAEHCAPEEGDMLLCEWGMHDLGGAPNFQLELTRRFIEPGDEDEDGMSQLSLTLQYAPAHELQMLGKDGCQCDSPAGLAAFEAAVQASPAYRAVTALKPQKVVLLWCLV